MPMESFSGVMLFLILLFLASLATLGILMPFFVFRIRNEIIKANEHLAALRTAQGEMASTLERTSRGIQEMAGAMAEAQQEKVRTGLLL